MNRVEATRDRLLAQDLHMLFDENSRLAGIDLRIEVRGGVAHISGELSDGLQRQRVRSIAYRLKGIHAVWDTLRLPNESPLQMLDLGCGNQKQRTSAIGIDQHTFPPVDLIAHAERGLPFPSDVFDQVFAVHFLEHVHELVAVMNEIHRVLKPKGVLHIMVPHHDSINAIADPTHVRFFHAQTFKYFCSARPGLRPFAPLCISKSNVDLFADLQPIKYSFSNACEADLDRYFD